jgi:hypothetical protein
MAAQEQAVVYAAGLIVFHRDGSNLFDYGPAGCTAIRQRRFLPRGVYHRLRSAVSRNRIRNCPQMTGMHADNEIRIRLLLHLRISRSGS